MKTALSQKIAALPPSATEQVDVEVRRLRSRGVDDIISLGVGEPCFDTPTNIKEAACTALRAGKTNYVPTTRDVELREVIREKLWRENSVRTSVEDIIVTAGAKFGLYSTFQAMLEPGDRVMVFDPAWVTYEPAVRIAGGEVVRIPTAPSSGFEPDPEVVKTLLDLSKGRRA